MGPEDELDPAAPELVLDALVHDLRSPLRAVSNYTSVGDEIEIIERIATAVGLAHDQLDGAGEYLELLRTVDVVDEAVEVGDAVRVAAADRLDVEVGGESSIVAPASLPAALGVLVADAVATGAGQLSVVVTGGGVDGWEIRLSASGRGVAGPGDPRGLAPFRWSDGSRTDGPLGPLAAWIAARRWGGGLELAAEPGVSTTWRLTG
ncbi:MAG: hypothetical protein AAGA99_17040 [Actinomycetota bacterium]